jgi:hypothetical protein
MNMHSLIYAQELCMIFHALIFVKHILIQDYAPILCVEFTQIGQT